ncbi:hypothetical protein Sps_03009 [Shewanella psychrophila]|uniref:Secreted protein n=1 Tax=Shewanella psychrophila TaxID=225848 RepID=A0A1S6HRK0_9GAMM|nr:hypothetical protein [Shewanella psychrophila]AQS38156.1 hypothetical protein Sps_03009 [Shewanella psychrophila]
MKYLVVFFTLLLALLWTLDTQAWDGAVIGQVNTIDVTHGKNYGFRVTLEGAPKLCGNDSGWAYLNDDDSNYQIFVSVLLAAKMSGTTVRLYTNQEKTSGNDYCHIGYISVS